MNVLNLFKSKKDKLEEVKKSELKRLVDILESFADHNFNYYWFIPESEFPSDSDVELISIKNEVNLYLESLYKEFSSRYENKLYEIVESRKNLIKHKP